MTDMTAALRILADTQGAEAGLRKLADQLRAMGADQREAAAAGAQAAAETGAAWADAGTRAGGAMEAAGSEAAALAAELAALGPLDLAVDVSGLEAARAQIDGVIDQMEAAARTAGIEVGVDVDLSALEAARAQVAVAFGALQAAVHVDADASAVQIAAREAVAALASIEDAAERIKPVIRADVDTTSIQQAGAALDETAAATGRAEAEAQEYQRALDQVRARFNPLFAASQQYEQELKDIAAAERLGAISATEAAAARERAARMIAPMTQDMRAFGGAAQLSAGQVGNLTAQFNDIVMMLMAGQNPLQLAIQQGTQVTQVIGPMGATGAVRALGAALVSMLNPINLVTIGGLAAGAALVNWLTTSTEKAVTLDDAMGDLSSRMSAYEQAAKAASRSTSDLRSEFGAATDEARALLREIAQLKYSAAAKAAGEAMAKLTGSVGVGSGSPSMWDNVEFVDFFDLAAYDKGLARRQSLRDDLIAGFSAVDAAGGIEDESARIDAMAAAARQLRDAFAAAADANGKRSEREQAVLLALNEQVLAALRLKEIKDAAAQSEYGPQLSPEQREVLTTTAELKAEEQMAALITQHGEDSLEVARARIEAEREVFRAKMDQKVSSDGELDNIMALWDASRGVAALERDREAQARAMLAQLQDQGEMQRAITTHGADSAEVAQLRVEQERRAFEALVDTLVPAGDLRDRLLESWDNAKGLAAVDMAGGVDAAGQKARDLAAWLGVSLETAARLAAMGPQGMPAGDPSGKVYSGRGGDPRQFGGGGWEQDFRNRYGWVEPPKPPVPGRGGGGGGKGGDRESLAGLSKEAAKLLADLDIAAGAVAEKVRAGMISVAEGQDEMASAKERAAGQLAELIARLERLGPAGKAAAEAARKELEDLAGQAGRTGEDIRKSLTENFEENFARSLATGENAMTAFADHVQMELARAFTNKFVTPMVTPLINAITGLFGFADGGVPDAPGLAAHRNTVVDSPTPFAIRDGNLGVMGEAGPEAIIPLAAGPAGAGVRATGPDGVETVLPLRRAANGALGVELPDAPAPRTIAAATRAMETARGIARALAPAASAETAPSRPPSALAAMLGRPAADVVDKPTPFAMPGNRPGVMGEAGPEAIIPLLSGPSGLGVRATAADGSERLLPLQRAADGALGVALPSMGDMMRRATAFAMGGVMGRLSDPPRMGETPSGGGGFGRPANIVINNNNPGARVEAHERHEAGGMTWEVVIEQLESAIADRMGRGVGPVVGVMGNAFGLGRVGR